MEVEDGEGAAVAEKEEAAAAGVKEVEEDGEVVEDGREEDGTKEDTTDMETMEDTEGREDDTSISICCVLSFHLIQM